MQQTTPTSAPGLGSPAPRLRRDCAGLQPVEAHSLMMLPMLSDLHELYSLPLAPHHFPAGWDYPD